MMRACLVPRHVRHDTHATVLHMLTNAGPHCRRIPVVPTLDPVLDLGDARVPAPVVTVEANTAL